MPNRCADLILLQSTAAHVVLVAFCPAVGPLQAARANSQAASAAEPATEPAPNWHFTRMGEASSGRKSLGQERSSAGPRASAQAKRTAKAGLWAALSTRSAEEPVDHLSTSIRYSPAAQGQSCCSRIGRNHAPRTGAKKGKELPDPAPRPCEGPKYCLPRRPARSEAQHSKTLPPAGHAPAAPPPRRRNPTP